MGGIYLHSENINFLTFANSRPKAYAHIKGSDEYAGINGTAYFFQSKKGVIVAIQISGLPISTTKCMNHIFAVHIHSGNECSGNDTDPFANAKTHYNPQNCNHPYHAGDMPPLFSCNGYAFSVFLTCRFEINEIIGKTIIVHSNPDDFTSQPSGNSGIKIACGEIKRH